MTIGGLRCCFPCDANAKVVQLSKNKMKRGGVAYPRSLQGVSYYGF